MRATVRVGVVSTYPPRREGFAEDAGELVRALGRDCEVVVCAVGRHGQHYPDEVVAVVATDELADYRRAGRVLAEHGVDVVLIRHDDGVYGGPSGSHVLDLAQELRRQGIAVVVSLQSVRRDASAGWTRTVAALTAGAARVLVPTDAARDAALTRRIAGVDQLRVVPVGAPAAVVGVAHRPPPPPPAGRPETALLLAALASGPVVTTIGPVTDSPAFAAALAGVARLALDRPEVRWVVARPGFARVPIDQDQARSLVGALGQAERVRFVDGPLLTPDLTALLARTAAYLVIDDASAVAAPRAVAAGCPVVTDPAGLADGLTPEAWQAARLAIDAAPCWESVGREVATVLVGPDERELGVRIEPIMVPPLRTDWLDRDLAALRPFEPDRDARLAVAAAGLLSLPTEMITPASWGNAEAWAAQTVTELGMAVQVGFAGGSRAVWGLGAIAAGAGVPQPLRQRAAGLRALLATNDPTDLAGAADVVLGLAPDPGLGEAERSAFEAAVARLDTARRGEPSPGRAEADATGHRPTGHGSTGQRPTGQRPTGQRPTGQRPTGLRGTADRGTEYGATGPEAAETRRHGPAWPCFGDRLGPDDIRLAHALLVAGRRLDDEAMIRRAVESIDWLARRAGLATAEGMFTSPVAGPRRAVEAGSFVEALTAAYTVTGAPRHARMAQQAMAWFHGANRRGEPVYDPLLGASQAGLGSAASLAAMSTEATLGYLAALAAMLSAELAVMPAAEVARHDLATVA